MKWRSHLPDVCNSCRDVSCVQENGHYSTRTMGNGSIPTQHASELQSLHRTVQQLEDRCLLLENIAQEQEDRLEVRLI